METSKQRPSRRAFLSGMAGGALAAAGTGWLPRVALASPSRAAGAERDILVAIFLRGGSDGLALVPPYGDPGYLTARPTLAVPSPTSGSPNAAIDLDGFFGFHPVLAPLMPAYVTKRLLVVHATGLPVANRSHFEKERLVETADPAGLVASGWIARHLQSVGSTVPNSLLRGIGVRTSSPHSLSGAPKTLPVPVLEAFGLAGSTATETERRATLQQMYGLPGEPLGKSGLDTLSTITLLKTVNFAGYVPSNGAVYPTTGSYGAFGRALKSTAALVKAQVGVEAIAIDLADWDTHGTQGVFSGTFQQLATALAQGLAAFDADVLQSPSAPGVTVVVVSEFGRTVRENGNAGTDHGYGNAMFVMGRCVDGGRVLTSWPGIAAAQMFQGQDLDVTIDVRDVFAEIVDRRLNNPNVASVFPGYVANYPGVTLC